MGSLFPHWLPSAASAEPGSPESPGDQIKLEDQLESAFSAGDLSPQLSQKSDVGSGNGVQHGVASADAVDVDGNELVAQPADNDTNESRM